MSTIQAAIKSGLNWLTLVLISLCLWLGLGLPVDAAAPSGLLNLTDLPAGFVPASPEEVSSCRMATEAMAFVLKQDAVPTELICVSAFSLAAATENPEQTEAVRKIYDAILQNPQALVDQAKAMGVMDVQADSLPGLGDVATGFRKAEPEIGLTEVALFRRGDVISSVLIRYEIGHEPVVPLITVARKVDRQLKGQPQGQLQGLSISAPNSI